MPSIPMSLFSQHLVVSCIVLHVVISLRGEKLMVVAAQRRVSERLHELGAGHLGQEKCHGHEFCAHSHPGYHVAPSD